MTEWDRAGEPHSFKCACDRLLNDRKNKVARESPSEFVA